MTIIEDGVAAPTANDLQSYVPAPDLFDNYVGRTIAGQDYTDVFGYARNSKINVLLEGPTGSGKTSAVQAFAAKLQIPFYTVSSSVGVEPSQLFGKYIPNADAAENDPNAPKFIWQDGPVTTVVREGGVLLLNEMNFLPERVATVLFSLLDSRREIQVVDHKGEVIKAHPQLLIVGDMNPDYSGTRPLNQAFRNRFGIQITWDYDTAVEQKLVASKALRMLAAQLRKSHSDGSIETPTSTNALIEFESMANNLGYEFAAYNFVQHYLSDERQPVQMMLDTYKDQLKTDFAKAQSGELEEEEETAYDPVWGIDTSELRWAYEYKV